MKQNEPFLSTFVPCHGTLWYKYTFVKVGHIGEVGYIEHKYTFVKEGHRDTLVTVYHILYHVLNHVMVYCGTNIH